MHPAIYWKMLCLKSRLKLKSKPSPLSLIWAGLTIIADLPVTVVPIGVLRSSGLPVGVQVVAPCWQDRQAIEIGKLIERVHPGAGTRVPPAYRGARLGTNDGVAQAGGGIHPLPPPWVAELIVSHKISLRGGGRKLMTHVVTLSL